MKVLKPIRFCLTACTLVAILSQPFQGKARQNTDAPKLRDGQHDFDFNLGTWRTHIRRLQASSTGSEWIELNGRVVVRKVWDGRAQIEEVEADGPNGRFEDLALFLYNPQSRQWPVGSSSINKVDAWAENVYHGRDN